MLRHGLVVAIHYSSSSRPFFVATSSPERRIYAGTHSVGLSNWKVLVVDWEEEVADCNIEEDNDKTVGAGSGDSSLEEVGVRNSGNWWDNGGSAVVDMVDWDSCDMEDSNNFASDCWNGADDPLVSR